MSRPRRKTGRLIVALFLFFFCLLAVLFFQSPLSRIQEIEVKGANRIDPEEVIALSGIRKGEHLLSLAWQDVKKRLTSHPQIKSSDIAIDFPGKVILHIQEYLVVATVLKDGRSFHPLLENGKLLQEEMSRNIDAPIITAWPAPELLPPFAKELSLLAPEIRQEISEIRLIPTETDPYKLVLYMRDGFEVRTTIYQFAKHLSNYPLIVANLDKPGIVNMSDAGYYYSAYPTQREEESQQQEERSGQQEGESEQTASGAENDSTEEPPPSEESSSFMD